MKNYYDKILKFIQLNHEKAKDISGKYFVKRRESKPSLEALREDVAERLWQESMKIIERFS